MLISRDDKKRAARILVGPGSPRKIERRSSLSMTIVQDFLAKCQEHELPLTPHFVRCKADKKAVDGHWQARPANTRAAADWLDTPGNLLGIIPASIGCMVVDVDQGGDAAVKAAISTPRPGPCCQSRRNLRANFTLLVSTRRRCA